MTSVLADDGWTRMNQTLRANAKWLSLPILGALLAGCETLIQEAPGEWAALPPGSLLRLEEPIAIAPGRARVFFRQGVLASAGASQTPSCGLEVRRIDPDGPQTVAAGAYRIVRVQRYWTEVAARMPALAPRFELAGMDGGSGGSPLIQEGYHFWLDASVDPNLMRLTCLGLLADMWEARPPTLDEIRAALGALAELEVPDTRSGPRSESTNRGQGH